MEPATLFLTMMFALLIAGLIAGLPAWLAIAGAPLLVAGIASVVGLFDPVLLTAFPQRVFGIMSNQLFVAVPLFVFMGVLMEKSGLARDMLQAVARAGSGSGRQMALTVLVVSALIAASTGIAGATIVMLGLISYPALVRAGVPKNVSGGLVVSAGTLGQIIPPSIVLVVLADQISNAYQQAQRDHGVFAVEPVTVSQLFAAALLPGLVLVCFYALYLALRLREASEAVPGFADTETGLGGCESRDDRQGDEGERGGALSLLVPLILILAVLGSILFGVATATEAAALGASGCVILAWLKQAGFQTFRQAVAEATLLCGVIFAIILAASLLSLVFRGLGGDEAFATFAAWLPGERWTALVLVLAVVFLLGFVLEFIEITFIVVPIAGPVLFAMDINPVWFAILLAMNLQTSFLTPPMGVGLFYFKSVAPKSFAMSGLYRGIVPFIVLQLLALALVFVFPQLALALPHWLFGS